MSDAQTFIDTVLIPFLKIPSISADESHKEDCDNCAQFLVDYFKNIDFKVTRHPTARNDVVFASKEFNPNNPTVLFYGHYDVQPVRDWETDPFTPVIKGDSLIARGAADNKGQIAYVMYALSKLTTSSYNIKVIIEGNEEYGSESFETFVEENKELLKTNLIVITDTDTPIAGEIALTSTLKGIVVSRMVAENPTELLNQIHNLHDPSTNKVLLDGFYDDVLEPLPIDPKIEKITQTEIEEAGINIKPEQGYTAVQHAWYRPTITPVQICGTEEYAGEAYKISVKGPLHCLHSGSFGGPVIEPGLTLAHIAHILDNEILSVQYGCEEITTAIFPNGYMFVKEDPTPKKELLESCGLPVTIEKQEVQLKPKISMTHLTFRLVANQKLPITVADTTITACAAPYAVDVNDPLVAAFVKKITDQQVVHTIASGGSIPISSTFADHISKSILFLGLMPPNNKAHGPGENFPISSIEKGMHAILHALK
ncbi:MAG: acetylornithine deacetylase/succinyl-diaminopimelate desuccinylase-like protein [Candidatus Woesearchaeota archaeon]|jgi:acetylornithine deacetylase/succinyl-diaminopimelate desuccinylase-like protein